MNEIKNEKKAIIDIDNVPGNYLESTTDLDFIEVNINRKNGTFYIPITADEFNMYNLSSPIIFIKFPFLPESFYGDDTTFRDDNMINIYAELFFDNNKTTKTTKEKIERLKKNNKLVGKDIVGYIELRFNRKKSKEYRFPRPLSFKVILNDDIEKDDNESKITKTTASSDEDFISDLIENFKREKNIVDDVKDDNESKITKTTASSNKKINISDLVKAFEIENNIVDDVKDETAVSDRTDTEDNKDSISYDNHPKFDLTDKEEKILNDIKGCIPNLSLSTISVLSEMFGYSVGCKRRISELEDIITELKEKL